MNGMKGNEYNKSPLFRLICRNLCDGVEFEYRFHPFRRWAFDIAWPHQKIAVEIDGGVWTGGRHSGGLGQIKDNEKINVAQSMGWRVYRFTPGDVKSGYYVKAMGAVFSGKEVPGMPKVPVKRRNSGGGRKKIPDAEGVHATGDEAAVDGTVAVRTGDKGKGDTGKGVSRRKRAPVSV